MLSAQDAAGITAANQVKTTNMPEMTIIWNRISGAANAGLATVTVEFEGNAIDRDCAELIKQNLLDQGYRVVLNLHLAPSRRVWRFIISW